MKQQSPQEDLTAVMGSLRTWMERTSKEEPHLAVNTFLGRVQLALEDTFAGSRDHSALDARLAVVHAAAKRLHLNQYGPISLREYFTLPAEPAPAAKYT